MDVLASANTIENSPLAAGLGAVLGWVFLGLIALWLLSTIALRVERMIMPSIPVLVVAGVFGLLVLGMLHHFGLF